MRRELAVLILGLVLVGCGDQQADKSTSTPGLNPRTFEAGVAICNTFEAQSRTAAPVPTIVSSGDVLLCLDSESPVSEDEFARSMLLTLDDFTTDWTEQPADDAASGAIEECDEPNDGLGKRGEAETGYFNDGGTALVYEDLTVFDDDAAAMSASERVEPFAQCIALEINDGALDDDKATYSRASVSPLALPGLADGS